MGRQARGRHHSPVLTVPALGKDLRGAKPKERHPSGPTCHFTTESRGSTTLSFWRHAPRGVPATVILSAMFPHVSDGKSAPRER
jgi:hypothetical protein